MAGFKDSFVEQQQAFVAGFEDSFGEQQLDLKTPSWSNSKLDLKPPSWSKQTCGACGED